jgi:uncharacterized repeat protein (TIGR03803 family)
MRTSTLAICALIAVSALLAACGGGSSLIGSSSGITPGSRAPAALMGERTHPNVTYSVIHNFGGGSADGSEPFASGLLDLHGTLYGTTLYGGANYSCNCGTVFAIGRFGAETVLHSFGGVGDGINPAGDLINVNGTLYGTTASGGGVGYGSYGGGGTFFSISPSGAETVLHAFGGAGDGAEPEGHLARFKGTFYGATYAGGSYSYGSQGRGGTVFSISAAGGETVLHSFGGAGDGALPNDGLIKVRLQGHPMEKLYGTTVLGGAYQRGTVFVISPSGAETVLYSFAGGYDGKDPWAGLVNVNGALYGTTTGAGAYGGGTVFVVSPSGTESVLHSFGGSGDGATPRATLINVNGTLYGTTYNGGANNDGTVFSISTSGAETVLHSFGGAPADGAQPDAVLLNRNGTLYGTTRYGGAYNGGSVFSLTP